MLIVQGETLKKNNKFYNQSVSLSLDNTIQQVQIFSSTGRHTVQLASHTPNVRVGTTGDTFDLQSEVPGPNLGWDSGSCKSRLLWLSSATPQRFSTHYAPSPRSFYAVFTTGCSQKPTVITHQSREITNNCRTIRIIDHTYLDTRKSHWAASTSSHTLRVGNYSFLLGQFNPFDTRRAQRSYACTEFPNRHFYPINITTEC